MKKIYRLVHPQARELAQEYIRNAPDGHVVTIAEPIEKAREGKE